MGKSKWGMKPAGIKIRRAAHDDFDCTHQLLQLGALTCDGVDPETGAYYVATSQNRVIGVIGFEKYDSSALLRSFAVHPDFRMRGIGAAMVDHALNELNSMHCLTIYLLTNTAEQFARRFGFMNISRTEIPARVLESSALGSACPSSSTCMKLQLIAL